MPKIFCSVEILTRNSEQTLECCLDSVKYFDDIIILDGNSIDRTLEIARRFGARIFKQYETDKPLIRITDFSEVRNKGLRLAKYDWLIFIDSDEYLSPEAVEEIRGVVASSKPKAYAFWQPRKYVLGGRVIECATTYPNQQVRFFNRQYVDGFIKPVHERIKLKPGAEIGWLKSVEYVPVEPLEGLRSRWARYIKTEEEMTAGASRLKTFCLILRYLGLFLLYLVRYLRGLVFCRGPRMPFRYEWTRHKYLLIFSVRLLKNLL